MGTIIPPPPDPPKSAIGVPCPSCFGDSKTFGMIDTPELVRVSISGVRKAADWVSGDGVAMNDNYILTQVADEPCIWLYQDAAIQVVLSLDHLGSFLYSWGPGTHPYFEGSLSELCQLEFINDITVGFTGGTGIVVLGNTS